MPFFTEKKDCRKAVIKGYQTERGNRKCYDIQKHFLRLVTGQLEMKTSLL
jgi:hypothetical protein